MESPQLSHMLNFQESRMSVVCFVLSRVSVHFNKLFHVKLKWCRTKALQNLGLGPNETELSIPRPGLFTSGEVTPVLNLLTP